MKIWFKIFSKNKRECFCAFCRSKRVLTNQKHVHWGEVLFSLVSSLIISLLFFQGFDFKILPIFSITLGLLEIASQVKYRMNLVCPHCGFDPILYLSSKEKACVRVQQFLEKRKVDPYFVFHSHKLNLPYRRIPAESSVELQRTNTRSNNLDIRM